VCVLPVTLAGLLVRLLTLLIVLLLAAALLLLLARLLPALLVWLIALIGHLSTPCLARGVTLRLSQTFRPARNTMANRHAP
jgi:hypothetical protein